MFFNCLILGDSIASGIGSYMPECTTYAEVGISSQKYIPKFSFSTTAKTVVISLGVNDSLQSKTMKNLALLREKFPSANVYWVLPAKKDHVRETILSIAALYGDYFVDSRNADLSRDGLHPTARGYKMIAQAIPL